MSQPDEERFSSHRLSLRRRIYEIMENGRERDFASGLFDRSLTVLILLNVVAFAAGRVSHLHEKWPGELLLFETVSVVIFMLSGITSHSSCLVIDQLKYILFVTYIDRIVYDLMPGRTDNDG